MPFVSAHRVTFDPDGAGAVHLTTFGGGVWTDTRPTITPVKPASGSTVKDRTPTVVAVVSDGLTDLTKADMQVFLDGKKVSTFSYDQGTNRLKFTPASNLSLAKHTVRIDARDEVGNNTIKQWSFKVVQ